MILNPESLVIGMKLSGRIGSRVKRLRKSFSRERKQKMALARDAIAKRRARTLEAFSKRTSEEFEKSRRAVAEICESGLKDIGAMHRTFELSQAEKSAVMLVFSKRLGEDEERREILKAKKMLQERLEAEKQGFSAKLAAESLDDCLRNFTALRRKKIGLERIPRYKAPDFVRLRHASSPLREEFWNWKSSPYFTYGIRKKSAKKQS